MADKFKPFGYPPNGIYDTRYWSIVTEDIFNLFSRLFVSGFTGKLPAAPGRIIKFCGNPKCYSPIPFYPEKRPLRCGVCKNIINWDLEPPEAQQTFTGVRKCPICGYKTNDIAITVCPYERDIVNLV
jgi:hypothetical protein